MPGEFDLKLQGEAAVEKALSKFAKETGVSMKFVCADQLRLWVQSLMSAKVTVPKIKKHGVNVVMSGLSRIFLPMGPQEIAWVREFRVDDGMLGGKRRFQSKTGAVWLVDADVFKPDASQAQMERWNDRHRGKNGRVSMAGSWDITIGRWKSIRKLHVRKQVLTKFRKSQKQRVGKLKAGWLDAAEQLGRVTGATVKVPGWVRKARPLVAGSADVSGMNVWGGAVTATNRVPYAAQRYGSWLEPLRKLRIKDMKGSMRKRADEIATRFNKGQL